MGITLIRLSKKIVRNANLVEKAHVNLLIF